MHFRYDEKADTLYWGRCLDTDGVHKTMSNDVERWTLFNQVVCTKVHGFFQKFSNNEEELKHHFSGEDYPKVLQILQSIKERRADETWEETSGNKSSNSEARRFASLKKAGSGPIF